MGFFPPVLRVCVCVRVCQISLSGMKDGRWRPKESPQGGRGGWLQARGEAGGLLPVAGGEVATLSAVLAFIKKGECERWVETAFPLLAESQHQEGRGGGSGRSSGGPEARMRSLVVSKSPAAPLPRNLAPGKRELEATNP